MPALSEASELYFSLKTELYDYQEKAVEKLSHIKVGALYMEMGTGKTRVALELVKQRLEAGKVERVLWLCPCSVKADLRRNLLLHAVDISRITICGIETLSSSIKANVKLLDMVQKNKTYLIVDESNLVKNHMAKRTRNIIRLAEYCKYKLILNGTPISRNYADLFAQWYILDWRILGYKSYWSFAANHIEYDKRIKRKINRCLNVDYLVKKIAPYTYQIRKDECLELPPKSYQKVYFDLTPAQYEHYMMVAEQLMFAVDELKPETIYRLFSGLQDVTSGFRVKTGDHLTRKPFFPKPLQNPRIEALMNITDNLTQKAVIFCKYTQEIEDIVSILNKRYSEGCAVPFHGKTSQKKRQENLDKFSKDVQFLVANKSCAGYGLNLQFCSYEIFYNNDWDYATRAQAEDRVHRIGQNENVHIVDICADETLDERILKCLDRKESLVDSFKDEIEEQKENKDLFIKKYVYYKDYKGRTKVKKVVKEQIAAFNDLKEAGDGKIVQDMGGKINA